MSRAIAIDDIEVDLEIFTEPFACDLTQCRGACCTIPECYGAPLEEHERAAIEEVLPTVLPMLSPQAQSVIAERGFAEKDPQGQWVTATVDYRECVFAVMTDGIAYCAFHRAWSMGMIPFPKPISCHLFPIRRTPSGTLYYERFPECRIATAHGRLVGSNVYRAVRTALERVYGPAWIDRADRVDMSITAAGVPCQS